MPAFARHGYSRQQALNLAHWEFWDFLRAMTKEEAKANLVSLNIALIAANQVTPEAKDTFIKSLYDLAEASNKSVHQGSEALRMILSEALT